MATQLICMCVLMFAVAHPELLIDQIHGRFVGNAGNGTPILETRVIPGPPDLQFKPSLKKVVEGENVPLEQLEKLPTPIPLKETGGADVMQADKQGMENRPGKLPRLDKAEIIMFTRTRIQAGDLHLAIALVFGLFVITNMMVYGVLKGRPWYLLPFFCFQVFDFILACLTAVGHYAWLPDIRDVIENNPEMPMRERFMGVNSECLSVFVLMAYVLVLFVKSYFIGVVWSCYQYLHARNLLTMAYAECGAEPLLLPPDYETATKMAPPKADDAEEADVPPAYTQPPPGYSPA